MLSALLVKDGSQALQIPWKERMASRVYSDEWNLEEIVKDLGKTCKIMSNKFKIQASCGANHAPFEATRDIVQSQHLKPSDIDEIQVGIPTTSMGVVGGRDNPRNPMDAEFN